MSRFGLTLGLPASSSNDPDGGAPAHPDNSSAQLVGRQDADAGGKFVKVAMAGAPYQRQVDLEAYAGYGQLLAALQDKFTSHFTIRGKAGKKEEMKLVDVVSGAEYVPTYEDKDGDWMLVGDLPWRMFVESCQRLRLVKSSDEAVKFEDALTLRLGLPGSSSDTNHKRASTSDPYLRLGPPDAAPAAASSDAALILYPPPAGSDAAPAPKAPLVGWPPVRSFRRNAVSRGKFVKVVVAGAPYQCRVSLEAYAGYEQLLAALQDKFTFPHFSIRKAENEETKLVDVVSGTEYVLTYEDKNGDSMLLGDVPWR
ncbi:hypothetical protein PR202_gb24694 [Eleusine coracana subsp. coracana]|uniref:Auxin-responsive protein n=1 Tax=Eleusine coracana subsp. coracana TaxID=191504 RepID=A0AAV5FNM4_ELECO|nr:hypothetical protein PR202_gb24694 [Eleusine coracana subsp. coracana]